MDGPAGRSGHSGNLLLRPHLFLSGYTARFPLRANKACAGADGGGRPVRRGMCRCVVRGGAAGLHGGVRRGRLGHTGLHPSQPLRRAAARLHRRAAGAARLRDGDAGLHRLRDGSGAGVGCLPQRVRRVFSRRRAGVSVSAVQQHRRHGRAGGDRAHRRDVQPALAGDLPEHSVLCAGCGKLVSPRHLCDRGGRVRGLRRRRGGSALHRAGPAVRGGAFFFGKSLLYKPGAGGGGARVLLVEKVFV